MSADREAAIREPSGRPIAGITNLGDVEWALTKARRFIFRGGDPADVEDYVNLWLDYRETLRGTRLERVGQTCELLADGEGET